MGGPQKGLLEVKWLEKHLGRFAIRNLSLVIAILYVFGYFLILINNDVYGYITLDPYAILHGQVFRLVTWLVVPPSNDNVAFVFIAILFYYSIGTSLERTWGTVRYNLYILGGVIFTVIGAFVAYGISYLLYGGAFLELASVTISMCFSTYYVCMSIFLAYAMTFPDAIVLFMYILPVKVKWLGILYMVFFIYDAIRYFQLGLWVMCVAMAASLLNFFIFFMMTRDWKRYSPQEMRRKDAWRRGMQGKTVNGHWREVQHPANAGSANTQATPGTAVHMTRDGAMHHCAICGRTEITNPDLEFRYCSKCEGGYEYCQDHLFSHMHAKNGSAPTLLEGQMITVEQDGQET